MYGNCMEMCRKCKEMYDVWKMHAQCMGNAWKCVGNVNTKIKSNSDSGGDNGVCIYVCGGGEHSVITNSTSTSTIYSDGDNGESICVVK